MSGSVHLADYGVNAILKTPIPDRAAFRKMSFDGRAIVTGVLGVTVDKVIDELAELTRLVELGNSEEHA